MNLKKSRWSENLKFNTYLTVQAVLMQFAYTNVTLCAKSWHFPKKSWCLLTCLFSANTKARFALVDIFSTLRFLLWEILMKIQDFFLIWSCRSPSNLIENKSEPFIFICYLKIELKYVSSYFVTTYDTCHMNEVTK